MADIELVNPIDVSEAPAWIRSMETTFLEPPIDQEWLDRVLPHWTPDRRWGVRDRGRWVATLGTHERRVTVPGGDVPADALTMVTVAATHRRRGLLTTLLTASLEAARERGDAVGILMAAEWPIYGRFGYSPAAWRSRFTLDPRRPGARVPASPDAVRQVDLDEFLQHARGVFTRSAAQRAGNIDRPDAHWQISFGTPEKPAHRDYVYVLAEAAGQVDGYLIWKAGGHQDYGDDGIVEIVELLAASGDAYRALWGYVLNMDLVAELRVARRPVDEPLRWLLGDGRVLNPVAQKDAQWVRLLDVPAALSARRYSVPDRLVIEVVDDAPGGYAAGRFVLDGGPDGASCRPTDRSPDLRLHQHSLASAYYGGVTLASQQLARPVDEETPGAAARLDAMLTTRLAPWPFTDF